MADYLLFEPSVKPIFEKNDKDLWFLFKDNKLMVAKEDNKIKIPRSIDINNLDIDPCKIQHMGAYNGSNCQCGEIEDEIIDGDIEFIDLRTLANGVEEDTYILAFKANLLLNWFKLNQYCGKCGGKMYPKDSQSERAMVCSNCGNTTWPRTSPAIIVSVTKGDKLLMAHNRQFPQGAYSILAGFVEYGESFEDCVKREVFEETGIMVKNIKYFGSQPWPFPNSMMIGYTAEYLDGDIKEDGEEIIHADWFNKEEVKEKHRKSISISSDLIEWFLNK